MKISVKGRIKTQICDAKTGAVLKDSGFGKNLVMDIGLNSLAQQATALLGTTPAAIFTNLIVGSGNSAQQISSGAITFTQSGTTLTASAGFFSAGMVGAIFKYGTGSAGAEYYITGYSDNQNVTVDTSASVIVPTVGTVWMVQKTALDNVLHAADGYSTNAGDCQTTFSLGTATHQRILTISQKGTTYNVNELGYNTNNLGTATNVVAGRFLLATTDVVGTSNFYRVTVQFIVTYSPAAPTAAIDVGTNINTAGTAMIEDLGQIHTVASSGAVTSLITAAGFDGGNLNVLVFATGTYTQNSTPGATGGSLVITSRLNTAATASWAYAGSRGAMTLSFAFSVSASGQTLYGVYCCSGTVDSHCAFDIKFTTPATAPTGTFAGTADFVFTYGRTLSN